MKRLLLLICTLLCANVLLAQNYFLVGQLLYTPTYSNKVMVILYDSNNPPTDLVIPSTVTYQGTTYSVTVIGNGAFENCSSLTTVTIPYSVTSIGGCAFGNCSSLTSIDIPYSVTSIGGGVFYGCSSLTSVTLPNNITELNYSYNSGFVNSGFFENCSSLTSVTIPNSVTSIGAGAFRNCSSLTSVTIPNSVTSIGDDAFLGCSSLTSIDIPNSVTSIGEQAFLGCSSLTSVTIPNSVTSIGNSAFYNCSSLTSLSIDMTSVSNLSNTELNTSILQNLTFGENVTSIASGAFNNYSFLQNVTCLATTPPALADNTVFPYPNIATLTVPCGTLEAYSAPTSFWNMFFAGRISESGYNVEVSVNDETFGSVAVESDCSTATLTATANEGYVFLSWNDGNTDNPRTVALTSDTSFTAIFALIDNSSLSEDAEFAELSVYPNPTRGKVTFNQAIEKVEVIDLSGKTLQTYENANEINIEALPAGVYHLRMTIEDKTTTRKVIKE